MSANSWIAVVLFCLCVPASRPAVLAEEPAASAGEKNAGEKKVGERNGQTVLPPPAEDLGPLPALGVEQVGPLLSLSPEQRQKIQALVQSARHDLQALAAGAQNGERDPTTNNLTEIRLTEIRQRMSLIAEEYRQQLAAILTPAQVERLLQVTLQVRGIVAVNDPKVAAVLGLSDEQRDRIAATVQKATGIRQEMARAPRPANRFERKDRRLGKRQLKRDVDAELNSILTPEQREKFVQLQGPPIGLQDLVQMQSNYSASAPRGSIESNEPAVELGEPKVDLGEPKAKKDAPQ